MDIATAISGVLQERNALQQPEGVSNPTYMSEHMQLLEQYNSALEVSVSQSGIKHIIQEAHNQI